MRRRAVAVLAVLASLQSGEALALACQSQNNGNWNAPATWTACGGGFPGAGDTVTISGNDNVTVNIANAGAVSVQLGINVVGTGTLTFNAGSALTVSGTLTFGNGNRNGVVTMTAGGTLSVGDLVFNRGTWTPGTGTLVLTAANTLPNNTNIDTFNNLTIGSGTTTLSRAITLNGDFAIAAGAGWNGAGNNVDLNGNFTNNGAFADGGATFLFSGGALQSLSGTNGGSTTFTNLTLNNGNNLQLTGTHDITVTTLLTLTNGVLITNANTVYVSNGSAIASAGGNDFVQGNLKKPFDAGNVSRTFEVGTGTTYSPVTITFSSVSVAGDISVSATAGSHPQLPTSGIDTVTPAKLNRWYSIANSAAAPVGFTTYTAAFTYVAGDIDAGAISSSFLAMRFASGAWSPTTLTGVPTNTSLSITGETGFGDFAIGQGVGQNPLAGSGGRFNAYDPPPLTPAGSINGYLRTKLSGTAFNLTIVHTNAGGTALANLNANVTIELLDAGTSSGTLINNCDTGWTTVIATSGSVAFGGGNNMTQNFNVAGAYPNVRVRVTRAGGAEIGCSGDRFAIRPAAFVIGSSANNNGAGAGTTVKAGSNFTLTATAAIGYNGTPGIDTAQVIGSPTAGTLAGSFTAGVPATGVAAGTFTYSEVGNIGFNANAVTDQNFTAVDQPADCTPDFSNALVSGRYGCYIGSAAIPQTTGSSGFGRFIPDHYFVAAGSLTNRSDVVACVSAFTYMEEDIGLTITLLARNSSGAVTQNYAGAYAKLNPATTAQLGLGAVAGATNLTLRFDPGATSSGSFLAGQATVTATVRIKRASPDNPDGPFTTKIGIAPNDSDSVTARAVDMNMDVDGVGGNDHVQVGADTAVRFGRLRMQNAIGSERLPLTVPIETQYWNGAGFITNTDDSCTALARSNIALDFNPPSNLSACETAVSTPSVTFSGGAGTLTLTAPGVGNTGSVLLTANLNAASGNYCNPASFVAAANAIKGYLLGRWNDASNPDADANTSYDDPPSARAAFGLYGGRPNNFIFQRENF